MPEKELVIMNRKPTKYDIKEERKKRNNKSE